VFGPRPFIVCPHGEPRPGGGFVWRGSASVRTAIDRALEAAAKQYGPYLDREHRLYVGFSQGAILGAGVVKDDAKDYPYAIFQEGFGDEMATRAFADQMKKRGVTRVLLGCSQGGCSARREPLRTSLPRAGVDARINDAGALGHVMDPRVYASLRKDVPWLLAGDPAWAQVVRDVEAAK
jgi:predicted esterase